MALPGVYLFSVIAAFLISAILTAVVKKIAVKLDFVARPREDRFHKSVIPLGGGIAIFITIALFCIAAAIAIITNNVNINEYLSGTRAMKVCQLATILSCAAVLFALGLWDDIKNLKPSTKLLVQFIAAFCAAYFADVRVELFIESKIITSLISSVWIVLLINIFNFLDNMDGASTGIALIATIILFFTAVMSSQTLVAHFALVFAGTLAGFLVFNHFPASIFMGDAGSLVIGFFVAALTLKTTYYRGGSIDKWYLVLMPLIIMALPLYDFLTVSFLRLKQGKSIFVGDTQHFSHRLKKRGLTEKQTVWTLYLATLTTGLGAIILKLSRSPFGAILVAVQIIMVLAIIAILESTGTNDPTKQQ